MNQAESYTKPTLNVVPIHKNKTPLELAQHALEGSRIAQTQLLGAMAWLLCQDNVPWKVRASLAAAAEYLDEIDGDTGDLVEALKEGGPREETGGEHLCVTSVSSTHRKGAK